MFHQQQYFVVVQMQNIRKNIFRYSNKFHHQYQVQKSKEEFMKNIELFKTIEALVEVKNKKIAIEKPSFALTYCKEQIQKKKLAPYDPSTKMNRIMKNFYQLQTYINVQKLFQHVNTLINEKKKEDIKSQPQIQWKSKQHIDVNHEDLIERVKETLGDYYKHKHMKQNQVAWKFLEELEEDTTVSGHLKQNSSVRLEYQNLIRNVEKRQNDDKTKKILDNSNWKFYERCDDVQYDATNKKPRKILPQTSKFRKKKQNLKQTQQRKDLIHQVGTYLQIILESKHKKKWAKNQKGNKLTDIKEQIGKQPSKKKYLLNSKIIRQRKTVCKQNFDEDLSFSLQHSALNNSTCTTKDNALDSLTRSNRSHQNTMRKIQEKKCRQVKDNFTFRNRNIKQKLMKKLQSFLDVVETEQKKFKNERGKQIQQINRIEAKYRINSNPYDKSYIVAQDHQIQAVQNKVHQQK